MPFTAQIMLEPPTHTLPTANYKAASRSILGDLVDVYERITIPPNPNGRLAFIHVDDEPAQATVSALKEILNERVISGRNIVRKRAWVFMVNSLTPPEQATLLADKEITLSWNKAKAATKKKIVTDASNPNSDTHEDLVI